MRLGFILLCDAVRLRPDGLFDALGASQQLVVVDPEQRRFKRTALVQLLLDEQDAGREWTVSLMLSADQGEWAVVGRDLRVRADEVPAQPGHISGVGLVEAPLYLAAHFDEVVERGYHCVSVCIEGVVAASWPVRVGLPADREVEERTWLLRAD